jgi:hypothetical protein
MREVTEKQFLHDVRDHKLTILRDEALEGPADYEGTLGHYRHLRLARPGTICMSYQIISVPWYLTMVGDMGSWTWSRLKDNFCFFRADGGAKRCAEKEGNKLFINPGYWAEKLQAVDKVDGLMEFSEDLYKSHILEEYKNWLHNDNPDKAEREKAKEAIRDQLYCAENEDEAHRALYDFKSFTSFDRYVTDTWEWNLKEYTYRYIWACYAVAWAIEQYDLSKQQNSITLKNES